MTVDAKNKIEQLLVRHYVEDVKEIPTFLLDVLGFDKDWFVNEKDALASDLSYRFLYNLLVDNCPFTAIVEKNYVDRTFRDSYYLYYAGKHKQYNRFCKRVMLFRGVVDKGLRDYPQKTWKLCLWDRL